MRIPAITGRFARDFPQEEIAGVIFGHVFERRDAFINPITFQRAAQFSTDAVGVQ